MCNSVTISNVPLPVAVSNFPVSPLVGSSSVIVARQTVSTTPAVIITANANRKKLIVVAESALPMYILFANDDATALTVSPTNYSQVIMNANNSIEDTTWLGSVGAITPNNTAGIAQVTEML